MTDFRTPVSLGTTGLKVGRLGIGSSFGASTKVIEDAAERGANYLYWGSIRRPAFGRAMGNLARRDRASVVLTIQSYSRVPALIAPSVEISLRRVGVEYFDFLLLGKWDKRPGDGLLEAALRLKEQGKVRHLMMSTHNRPLLASMFEEYDKGESPFDVFMFRYNAVHRGAEKDVFPFLPAGPKPGILTYTTTRWGHLLDPKKMPPGETPPPASDCYRFALSNENVDVALCGPADEAQMEEALRALERGPLKPDERERIERIGDFIYGRHKPNYEDLGD
ncbi:MAG: aldo/keto reductase [Deltaproteobacteria bacterium]|nr:aldo/keto reductase [Deltaproteobacteria bacterium]MBW2392851.1 aldo/keto reductase [Deltaproteobacteria bacterium]